ncbi:MAG: hypothetical protein AAB930_01575 [Patescibacteria group bacterium]
MGLRLTVPEVGVAELALTSKIFRDWQANLDKRFKVKSLVFQHIDIRSASSLAERQVRNIKFEAEVEDREGRHLHGSVFMRGSSVAILVVLVCEGKEYTVIEEQARFPSGCFAFPEIPAGSMSDSTKDFVDVAVSELDEELGLKVAKENLVDMTQLVYGDRWRGVFPSPGLCDEYLRIFLYKKNVTREFLDEFRGKAAGLEEENERIVSKVILLDDLVSEAPDGKTLSALALYKYLKERDKLNI